MVVGVVSTLDQDRGPVTAIIAAMMNRAAAGAAAKISGDGTTTTTGTGGIIAVGKVQEAATMGAILAEFLSTFSTTTAVRLER
jgi:hypothetical protein